MKIIPDILNHWSWHDKPFAKGQAIIDLLFLAESKSIFFRGKVHHTEVGQVITSENELANRWGWSRTKVRNFLQALQNESLIKIGHSGNTAITVLQNAFIHISKPNKIHENIQEEIQLKKQLTKPIEQQKTKDMAKTQEPKKEQEKKPKKDKNKNEMKTDKKPIFYQKTIHDALKEKENEKKKTV